jgi:gas vesicle protein
VNLHKTKRQDQTDPALAPFKRLRRKTLSFIRINPIVSLTWDLFYGRGSGQKAYLIKTSRKEAVMNDKNTTKICGAILLGGLIGAAIALLSAPKSGRETRKDIARAVRRARNSTVDLIEDTIDDVNDLVNDLRDKAADVVDQGSELSDKVKKEIVATLEQGQKAIERQKQKFSEIIGL